ncbi:YigZ family protein [Flavobacteriaceae bacterium TP-CH-4]|uniref:YigZ family protein n=1 Tax=Pelagihabitans pacificus TaxID=2696054 RepID=A0A967AZC8_9FLAO|nr:YigZ family protein [Pelagihabitans pacificus]NHF59321.1 YigZ family protein [Pelagihabitans pacificus]
MEGLTDTYKTLDGPSPEVLYKNKKSKFYGYAFPITDETEVKPIITSLRRKHPAANHVCYAWRLGVANSSYRANDDGEPKNSAGIPIYGQLQSFGVTNLIVAVARVFGGTKLGVNGLITSYRAAAQMALEASHLVEKVLQTTFVLAFDYPLMDVVMRLIKQHHLEVVSQRLELGCELVVAVRKDHSQKIMGKFKMIYGVRIKEF